MKFIAILFFILFFGCSNYESEESYCEKRADYYFSLCLTNVRLSPGYFGKPEWSTAQIQSYAEFYCISEYLRKKRCVDKSESIPRKKDP